jgi:coiled-coil domain-containing protein 39
MAASFAEYVDEAEFDFLPPSAIDDNLRNLDRDVKEKASQISHADTEIQEMQERVKVMREHLKNVQSELGNTQHLLEAKSKEIEGEDHLKMLAERELGRVLQEIKKVEREKLAGPDRVTPPPPRPC